MSSVFSLLLDLTTYVTVAAMVLITAWVFFLYFSSMFLGIREMLGGKPAFVAVETVATAAAPGADSNPA